MECTNCFGGCTQTTSDKCVKYTGNPIEFLNIHTGDSLIAVENSITAYLSTVYSGVGVFPVIDSRYICDIVSNYLTCVGCGQPPTLVDILTAVIRAICDIEAEIVIERERIDVIEASYDLGCLGGTYIEGTHNVLQAVINALCIAIGDIQTLNNILETYVKIEDIGTYIQNYINTNTTTNLMYTKMVPFAIYPFYPDDVTRNSFSSSGAGLGIWDKVYYCNGRNDTPDLRGRSLIGVVSAMGSGNYDNEVDPYNGNPDYILGDAVGQNTVVLLPSQVAAHSHVATVTIDDPGHTSTIQFHTTGTSVNSVSLPSPGANICAYPVVDIEGGATSGQYGNCANNENHSKSTATLDKTGLTGTNVTVSNAVNTPAG